jgi:voltage-gated potassium channel
MTSPANNPQTLREKLHDIIFEAETPAGKAFDIGLIICILLSILVVMLESVEEIRQKHGTLLFNLEWMFNIIFTVEYVLRIWTVSRKRSYVLSFFGIVDLLSILPTYLSLFLVGANSLLVIRSLRLIRIFRVLKLARFVGEGQNLAAALRASRHKITIFLITIITTTIITGTLMYLIEGRENGFTSIPRSIYWAIVTMTTVGYGDIAPHTTLGQTLASFIMIMGYAILAVPTGIVTAELAYQKKKEVSTNVCRHCLREGHDTDAVYCKFCGEKLD